MPYNYGGKLYRIIWWETLPYNNYGGKLYRIMVGNFTREDFVNTQDREILFLNDIFRTTF